MTDPSAGGPTGTTDAVAAASDAPGGGPEPFLLVIDNYDSFVYNLVQLLGPRATTVVRRNDAIDVEELRDLDPDGIVLSPGPGHPDDAGVTSRVFDAVPATPILGVCLGHQALCAAHGADVAHAPAVVHGKPSPIRHDGAGVFADLPPTFAAGRYHSLAVERAETPAPLIETAWTVPGAGGGADGERRSDPARDAPDEPSDDALLMGVRHRDRPHVGVQFHPESVLTGDPDAADLSVGRRLLHNFCAWSASGAPPREAAL